MIDLLSDDIFYNPFPIYKELRDKSPVTKIKNGNMWAVSRYVDAKEILKDPKRFSSRASIDIIAPEWLKERCRRVLPLTTTDPPKHTRQRQLINQAFASRVIASLEPIIRARAATLIDTIVHKKEIEFFSDFSLPYCGNIISLITGTEKLQPTNEIYEWLSLVTSMGVGRPDDKMVQHLEDAIERQIDHFETVINSRIANPGSDLVGELIEAQIDGNTLEYNDLVNVLDLLARAGYMPPTHILTNIMCHLSQSPDYLQTLQQSPHLIPKYIEEILRYSPSIHGLVRRTTETVSINGITMPANEDVLIIIAAANRDKRQFDSPEKFDIERKNNKNHLTFGFGPHICIGADLARLELRIVLEELLPRIKAIQCPSNKDIPWLKSFFFRGAENLHIALS